MEHKRMGDRILARLAAGDEVIASLKDLARAENIPAASITGLGAVDDITLALYHPARREYLTTRLTEELEVASMTGNIAWLDGDPVVHIHGVVSRADCATAAGHFVQARVSVTLEVMLHLYPERIARAPEPAIGLNLLALRS